MSFVSDSATMAWEVIVFKFSYWNRNYETHFLYLFVAILVLYLTDWLSFSEDNATAIYHTFVFLCYFTPIFGAILADGFIGRYKYASSHTKLCLIVHDDMLFCFRTILYLSIVYALGSIVLSLTAFPPPFRFVCDNILRWTYNMRNSFFYYLFRVGPMIGLLLISVGTGGIKPCVSSFGGDQFASHQVWI